MKSLHNEFQYLNALKLIRDEGSFEPDRTGTGTYRYPGITMKFDLAKGFPLLTTKKILFYPMTVELLWFLQGRNDLKWLQDRNCNIWNQWHHEDGTIGPGYGVQWRRWAKGAIHSVDQLKEVIAQLKANPQSRRLIISAWNVSQLDQMALPPCHFAHQYIAINGTLHIVASQRSGDFFLGIPFNIASYALLLELVAKEVGMKAGTLTLTVGDAHIYSNHLEQVDLQLSREPLMPPDLVISPDLFPKPWNDNVIVPTKERGLMYWLDNYAIDKTLEQIKELISVENYNPHPFIKAPVAV
jgi:thymidylate synthase